jgi:hypothetical protein
MVKRILSQPIGSRGVSRGSCMPLTREPGGDAPTVSNVMKWRTQAGSRRAFR